MKEVIEEFRDIPGFEGYQVSNLGRVKSLPKRINSSKGYYISKEKLLKGWTSNNGYHTISLLLLNGKKITKSTHQVVAMTFLNHIPDGFKVVVDHINNNRLDNRLENLQLITNRENSSKDQKNRSSIYVGVCWDKYYNKWKSDIRINGNKKHLGYFKDELEAHNAYQNKLKEM